MTQNRRPVQPGGANPQRSVSGQPRPANVQRQPASVRQRPGSAQQRPAGAQYGQPTGQRRAAGVQQRPAGPRPARSAARLPQDFLYIALACAAVLAVGILLQAFLPDFHSDPQAVVAMSDSVAEIHGTGPIRINELMSSNSANMVDENGVTADWIEILNVSNRAVSLEGYSLGKTEHSTNVFVFPSHTLQSGESVLVFADSTLRSAAGQTYHAPFRLSSKGGTLMLFAPNGAAIDSVNFPAIVSDSSYVRVDSGKWEISSRPTPGMANTEESWLALHEVRADSGVEITEILSSNTAYAADETGMFHDYIELHNTTGATVDLSGWFVSDTAAQPMKWRIPDGFTLQPGEYRIIYASGLDRVSAEYPHAGFGLSSEGESAVLADSAGRLMDEVQFGLLKTDEAWLKQANGSWTVGTPTPGHAN